jgi:hypothetical protein
MKNLLVLLGIFFTSAFSFAQTDLFFSEYIEGSGNNKGVEIYNPTNAAIDLNNYWVVRFSNGSSVFTEGGVTHLSGTLEPYKTFVLVNGQTTSTPTSPACSPVMQALADQLDGAYPAPTYMNGNDAIGLIKTPNGEAPSADFSNVTAVDLIGKLGMGSAISAETGWSYVQDSTLTYNNASGSPVTGKVINYIVQSKATDNVTYGPFWMSWTSDHSLIRKPNVIQGVVANPAAFVVNMEWDTVPAKLDSVGHFVYKDIWDNLGSHSCVADPSYSGINDISSTGTLNIYPNPVVDYHFALVSNQEFNRVQVYNVDGKEIHAEMFASPKKLAEVAIGKQIHGVYLVKITFGDQKYTTQKILVK